MYARQDLTPGHTALGITPLSSQGLLASALAARTAHAVSEAVREGRLDIDLAEQGLSEVPSLAAVPWLHVVNLDRNELQMAALLGRATLQAEALPELRSLSACHNALVGALPAAIGSLAPCLEELALAGNLISSPLPSSLCSLVNLEWVSLASNRIAELPGGVLAAWPRLRHLDLRSNLLQQLPPEVAQLPLLEELHLSGNALAALPEAWATPALAVLSAAANALLELPTGLAAAAALQVVDLSANKLTVLPGEILEGWPQLQELYVSANALAFLPEQLGQLAGLEVLAAAGNQLAALPEGLARCTALRELYLAGNKGLSSLPEGSQQWQQLQTLSIKMCKFKTLPL